MRTWLAEGEDMGTVFVGIEDKDNIVNFCYWQSLISNNN